MKMNFLQFLDEKYSIIKKENNILSGNTEYRYYQRILPIKCPNAQKFECVKINDKTKILICFNSLKVYLSDLDIISNILKMEEDQIKWFIDNFINVYSENFEEFEFVINEEIFQGLGLPYKNEDENILLHTDNEISINSFIFILNFIIYKDYLATKKLQESIYEEKNKKNLLKITLCKYISLLKFYYFKDNDMKEFLEYIEYPVNKDLNSSFSSYEKVKETNELFQNLKMFEEYLKL